VDKIRTYHKNYDIVLKEASSAYTDKSLAFLGVNAKVVESLNIEHTEVTVHDRFSDQVFKLDSGCGVNLEWEAKVSRDDLLRFAIYNANLARKYEIDFDTVIVTRNKVSKSSYKGSALQFTPKIVSLNTIDGKVILNRIRKCLDGGEQINPIEVVYAPLYNNHGASYEDVYQEIAEIVFRFTKNKHEQVNLLVLSALLINKIVGEEEYNRILEVIKMALTSYEALDMLVSKLDEARISEIAKSIKTEIVKRMLDEAMPIEKIVKLAALPHDEVLAIKVRGDGVRQAKVLLTESGIDAE